MESTQTQVESHGGLVRSIANRLSARYPRADFDDLVSAGNVGLVIASRKYVPGGNAKFSSMAYPWIWGEMMTFVQNESYHARCESIEAKRWGCGMGDEDFGGGRVGSLSFEPAAPPSREFDADEWEKLVRPLAHEQRQVVLMYARDGLTQTVISRKLGRTLCWVARSLHASVAILRSTTLSHVHDLPDVFRGKLIQPQVRSRPLLDSRGNRYASLKEASRAVGRSPQALRAAANSGWKCAGLKWSFEKQEAA